MSAQKNTLFNYFKSTNSPGSSPRLTPKPKGETEKKATTPKRAFSSLQNRSSENGDSTPKTGSGKKRRKIVTTPGDSNGDRDKEEENTSPKGSKEPSSGLKSGQRKARRRIARIMSDSENEEEAETTKKRITDSDLEDEMDDDDPSFTLKKGEQHSSSDDEEEEDDIEDDVPTPDEDEGEEIEEEISSSKRKNVTSIKKSNGDLNLSFKTKQKLASFSAGSQEPELKSSQSDFVHLNFSFLDPKNIKDKNGKCPGDPDYSSRTLFVPGSFLNSQTPAHRQWWALKSDHFDKILFFKMGKFYECFHMDAVEVVKHCGISFMKKEYSHCGFPEVSFNRFADILIDKNFKIARIEQTETPEMMEKRCKVSTKKVTKFDKVVARELCQVSSAGTRITEQSSHDYDYLLAVIVKPPRVGICFVDTTVGVVRIGEYDEEETEDVSRTQLNLCHLNPVEILLDGQINEDSKHLLDLLDTRFPHVRRTVLRSNKEFMSSAGAVNAVIKNEYYSDYESWPDALKALTSLGKDGKPCPKPESELGLRAFGAVLWYLTESLIDHGIMVQGKIESFEHINDATGGTGFGSSIRNMVLDDSSIYDLDILSRSKKAKSLFGVLDFTVTPFGRRLLKKWVCSPLYRPNDIHDRQKAVEELSGEGNISKDSLTELKKSLKSLPDFERLTGIVATNGVSLPKNHPENRAIYFDGGLLSKKKIRNFVECLKGFRSAHATIKKFLKSTDGVSGLESQILNKNLYEDYPSKKLSEVLDFFENALDIQAALSSGKIVPAKGVDPEYDAILEERSSIATEVKKYLESQRKLFGGRDIKFVGSGKNAYQLEVPMDASSRAKPEHEYSSQRKGFKRYVTAESKDFLSRSSKNDENEFVVLSEVSTKIFHQFSEHTDIWTKTVMALSTLDAIMSLAQYSFSSIDGVFPEILPVLSGENEKAVLKYDNGSHPIVYAIGNGDFIPNSMNMCVPLMILTGANMGGKSTLMRQTALLVVLAQLGCRVPASMMTLTPVDRIFTRIGAADNIFAGESTFMVELSETSKILRCMTPKSLIIVDELGRGTTTYDGMAIAASVADYMASKGQRILFSTHFHRLTAEFEEDSRVKVYHMAYIQEGENELTFLYKLANGACPKSHGFNTARLAGIPQDVINYGLKASSEFENKEKFTAKFVDIVKEMDSLELI